MKYGINVKIDVTKLDKSKFHKGAKGTYADLTIFVDTEKLDQYENNGIVSQGQTKEERASGVKSPIIGNNKIFWTQQPDGSAPAANAPAALAPAARDPNSGSMPELDDDDIPF
jgi:hypothetical protein